MNPNHTSSPLNWLLVIIAGLASITIISSSLLGYSLVHFDILRHDGWPVYYNHFLKLPFWQGIWAEHTGHRMVLPGLLDHANLSWFHGNLANLIMVSLVVEALSAWILARCVTQQVNDQISRYLLFGLVFSLMLWMGYKEILAWAFGLTLTLPVFGAAAACYCIVQCQNKVRLKLLRRWFVCAWICALISTLSYASGVLIWPILVFLAICIRLPRTYISLLLVCGATLAVALFIPAPGDVVVNRSLAHDPHSLAIALAEALGVLGNMPANAVSPYAGHYALTVIWFARGMGVLALILTSSFFILWLRRKQERHWLLAIIGIALFAQGSALAVGLARYNSADTWYMAWGLAPRFGIFSGALWTALTCGLLGLVAQYWHTKSQRHVFALVTLSLSLALLPSQAQTFIQAGMEKMQSRKATLALVTGVNDKKAMFGSFWPYNHELVLTMNRYLRSHRMMIYRQPWSHWPGQQLPDTFTCTTKVRSGLIGARHIGNGWRITGWITSTHRDALIIGVDATRTIRALAEPVQSTGSTAHPLRRPLLQFLHTVNPHLPAILGWGHGWYGYVQTPYKPENLNYYLVKSNMTPIAHLTF